MGYTTKVTWLGKSYGCRVFYNDALVVEGRVATKKEIGPAFRDLLRTIDKTGNGDSYTKAARYRNNKPGNLLLGVKHIWSR